MITTEQIKDLVQRRDALYRYLAVEDKRIAHEEEQLKTTAPDFWDRPDEAEKQLKKVAAIKSWIDNYEALSAMVDDLEVVAEFVREGGATEEELDSHYARTLSATEELEMRNMLRSEEDKLGAIVDINSGAGGTESLDWASMLLRMYTRWGERNGYKVRVQDFQAGEEVGVKSATILALMRCFSRLLNSAIIPKHRLAIGLGLPSGRSVSSPFCKIYRLTPASVSCSIIDKKSSWRRESRLHSYTNTFSTLLDLTKSKSSLIAALSSIFLPPLIFSLNSFTIW